MFSGSCQKVNAGSTAAAWRLAEGGTSTCKAAALGQVPGAGWGRCRVGEMMSGEERR